MMSYCNSTLNPCQKNKKKTFFVIPNVFEIFKNSLNNMNFIFKKKKKEEIANFFLFCNMVSSNSTNKRQNQHFCKQ